MNVLKYLTVYTVLFAILFFGCFGIYCSTHVLSFLSRVDGFQDGFEQHYTAFVYIGRWVREIISTLWTEHHLIFPMWNHGMGYGADIPTTLAAYIYDPFNYLAAIFPEQWSETVFDGIIIFKFYLSGLAFSGLAFYRRQKFPWVLAGALIYTFCGTMYIAFIQVYFINPMYLFPLLIVGFDRLWNENKFGMYCLMLAWCLLNHFYFAYMMCWFLLGYGLLRFVEDGYLTQTWKENIIKLLKIGIYSLLAFGIAAVALLPLVDNLLQQGRMGIEYYVPRFYHSKYYGQLLMSFVRPAWMWNRDCIIGMGAVALPCLFVFLKNKGNLRLKVEFWLLTLCLILPFCGYVLNGFSYPANRWVWAYCLVVAYIVTITLPLMDKKAVKFAACWVLIYILLSCFYTLNFSKSVLFVIGEASVLALCYYAAVCGGKQEQVIKIAAVVFSALLSAHTYFDVSEDALGRKNMPISTAYQTLVADSGLPVLQKIMNGDARRYNQIKLTEKSNASWLYKLSGTNFYMSIYNDNIDRFHRAVALLTPPWVTQYLNLNRRTELAALLGVEYFITDKKYIDFLPVGYHVTAEEENYVIARPEFETSLIYGFDKALSEEVFAALNPFERQQVLLQAVVLENPELPIIELSKIQSESLLLDDKKSDYKSTGGRFDILSYNPFVNLFFSPVEQSELYVYFNGLDFNEIAQMYFIGMAGYHDKNLQPNLQAMLKAATNRSHVYGNKHEWLVNLGYTDEFVNKIRLFFSKAGRYNLENMRIYARSKAAIVENIKQLQPLENNVKMTTNKFEFEEYSDKKQYAFISIPYSQGWQAYVDGKKATLLKADLAFMALLLPEGQHQVKIVYQTPYLQLGSLISVLSLLLFGCLFFVGRRRKQVI